MDQVPGDAVPRQRSLRLVPPQRPVLDHRLDVVGVQHLMTESDLRLHLSRQGLDPVLRQVGPGLFDQRPDALVVPDLGVGDVIGQRHLMAGIHQ